jgi:hypothetical protein
MLTHMYMVMYTWWCWHICKGDVIWEVEKCGDSLSLLPNLRGRIQRRNGGERMSLVWPNTGPDAVSARPARPVPRKTRASGHAPREQRVSQSWSDTVAHPVMWDQMHLVDKVALWNLSGQWPDTDTVVSGCGVERVRSNSETRPVDLLTIGVQVTVGIARTMLNAGRHVDDCEEPDAVQRVRSVWPARPVDAKNAQWRGNGHISSWGYKYLWWLALAGSWAHYSLGGLRGSAWEPSNSLLLDSVHPIEWVSDSSAIASWGCIEWH